jgi:GT2 family glycosyltransferase
VLIFQGGALGSAAPTAQVLRMADTVVRLGENLGFAAANNIALAQAQGQMVALVNDDVVVEPGWLEQLVAVLDDRPEVASVQGLNLQLDNPSRIDGWGLGFNRRWQAVQLGVGQFVHTAPTAITEVFGVSATAALYRRAALEKVGGTRRQYEEVGGTQFEKEGGTRRQVFDERLFAYYEDVELAARLRGAGFTACAVPSARTRHAGSSTGKQLPWGSRQLIYGNRYLVFAGLLGRAFWPRLPSIIFTDLRDLARALGRSDRQWAMGILAGLLRAAWNGYRFAHLGPPALPVEQIRQFSRDPRERR